MGNKNEPIRGVTMYGKCLFATLALILISACNQASEVIGENDLTETEMVESDLEDKAVVENDLVKSEWVLTSINGEELLEGTNITLAFYPSELSGFAGCNGYGSQYEVDDSGGILIREIVSQAEGCIEPEGVLDQESDYLSQLLDVEQYVFEGSELILSNLKNEQSLVYSRREPFEMDPAMLENSEWNLVPTDSFPLIDGSEITLSFLEGAIEGFGGCRDYYGEYETEGDKIVFPMMMMTSELCDDLDIQIQEAKFTTWLELSTHYRIGEYKLELFLADGNELVFESLE
jgi:heat shock protein HslJ